MIYFFKPSGETEDPGNVLLPHGFLEIPPRWYSHLEYTDLLGHINIVKGLLKAQRSDR